MWESNCVQRLQTNTVCYSLMFSIHSASICLVFHPLTKQHYWLLSASQIITRWLISKTDRTLQFPLLCGAELLVALQTCGSTFLCDSKPQRKVLVVRSSQEQLRKFYPVFTFGVKCVYRFSNRSQPLLARNDWECWKLRSLRSESRRLDKTNSRPCDLTHLFIVAILWCYFQHNQKHYPLADRSAVLQTQRCKEIIDPAGTVWLS